MVKEGKSVILHGEEVRKHPEWRGTYEGAHEICTSLIEVPLKTNDGKVVGLIKIENHKNSDSIKRFEDLNNSESKIYKFTEKHKEILTILASSVMVAIETILYRKDTYKKIFGIKILKMINKLQVKNPESNKEIHEKLKEFYSRLKTKIEDIGGIDSIYDKVTRLVTDIVQILNLRGTMDIINNIGPAFETLLGTDIRYREHFVHQFQVFLLGYYLINKKEKLAQQLIDYLNNGKKNCSLDDVLKIWFIASMFHDSSYSIAKIDGWLNEYFKRVALPPKFQIMWADIFTQYEAEKTKLVELMSKNFDKPKHELACILKDAFIEDHDHGLISGLLLMKNLHKRCINESLLMEACCAIALHTDTIYSKIGKINIKQSPFAFLLIFCDNVQEWGRPRMIDLISEIKSN